MSRQLLASHERATRHKLTFIFLKYANPPLLAHSSVCPPKNVEKKILVISTAESVVKMKKSCVNISLSSTWTARMPFASVDVELGSELSTTTRDIFCHLQSMRHG